MILTRRSLFTSLALALPASGLAATDAMAATGTTPSTHKSKVHHTVAASHKAGTRHAAAHKSHHTTHVAQTHHTTRKPTKAG